MVQFVKLLICYPAGARGDFLANILQNRFVNLEKAFKAKHISSQEGYIKVHNSGQVYHRQENLHAHRTYSEILDYYREDGYLLIRILCNSDLELAQSVLLASWKNQPEVADLYKSDHSFLCEKHFFSPVTNKVWTNQISYIKSLQLFDVEHRHKYHYILTLADMFDTPAINRIYERIHKAVLSRDQLNKIEQNIELSREIINTLAIVQHPFK